MMTLHKLSAGDGYTYLTRQVATGDHERSAGQEMADYYTAAGAPPGRWMGHGAVVLGVEGHVHERQMLALFGEGLHPDADRLIADGITQAIKSGVSRQEAIQASTDAARLGRRFYRTEAHEDRPARAAVAGFDLVFTPVKSVSVLWALGDGATRRGVEAAHEAAVRRALGWLEEHVAYTRSGTNGIAQIDTDGLTIAAFDHRDSRSGEPNLHTHAAVSTKVRGSDGRWRSLDARVLHSAAVAASELYNTAIEEEMSSRLGVSFTPRGAASGQQHRASRGQREVREVTGVDPRLIEVFSSRRAMIEARIAQLEADYRQAHGHEPPRSARLAMAQQATLATREAKAELRSLAEQRTDWLRTATTTLGLSPTTPSLMVEMLITQRARPHTVGREHPDPTAAGLPSSTIQPARNQADVVPVTSTGRVSTGDRDPSTLRPVRLPSGEVLWLDTLEIGLYQPPTEGMSEPSQISTSPALATSVSSASSGEGAETGVTTPAWTGPTPDQIGAVVLASVETQRTTWTRWTLTAEAQRRVRRLQPALAALGDGEAAAERAPGTAGGTADGIAEGTGQTPADLRHRERLLIEQVVQAALDRSLPMSAPALNPHTPEQLTRRDGTSVFTVAGAQRFSSTRILDAEQELLRAATTTTTAAATTSDLYAVLAARHASATPQTPKPHAAQIELARVFATSSDLLEAGIGPAGTGKTTAMSLMAETVSHAGHRVLALAPSAAAAAVLGAELGVHAETLHKFLHVHASADSGAEVDAVDSGESAVAEGSAATRSRQLGALALRPGDVVLVDEAGMAGTLMLRDLVRIAARDGALVRVLGDPQQLGAVESGGALRLLEHAGHATSLTQVHRFSDPDEAAASLLVRAGKQHAVAFYDEHERLHGGSAEAMQDAAYNAWRTDLADGRTSLLLASAATVVTELNERARADLISTGAIADPGETARHSDGVRVEVDLHDGTHASAGDTVVTRRNARHLSTHAGRDFVKNGDIWTVQAVGEDGSLRVAHRDHHGHLTLPAAYVAEHLELAYASTIHRAQGMTVDTAHLLMDEGATTREGLYVALTRGRHANHVYAVTEASHGPSGAHGHHPVPATSTPERTAADVFVAAVAAESAERPAHEVLRTAQDEAVSLSTLIPQYLYACDIAAEIRYGVSATAQAVLAEHFPATSPADAAASAQFPRPPHLPQLPKELAPHLAREHTAWPQLTRALADVARAGEDPAQVMHQLLTTTFAGARDPFLVLVARAQHAADAYPAPLPQPFPDAEEAQSHSSAGQRRAPGAALDSALPSWLPAPPPVQVPEREGHPLPPPAGRSNAAATASGTSAPAQRDQPSSVDLWLNEHAALITARLDHLLDLTAATKPTWATPLLPAAASSSAMPAPGQAPASPASPGGTSRGEGARVRLLREVLAWRDQQQITHTDSALGARPSAAADAKTWDRLNRALRTQQAAMVSTTVEAEPAGQRGPQVTTAQPVRSATAGPSERDQPRRGQRDRDEQHPRWDTPPRHDGPHWER